MSTVSWILLFAVLVLGVKCSSKAKLKKEFSDMLNLNNATDSEVKEFNNWVRKNIRKRKQRGDSNHPNLEVPMEFKSKDQFRDLVNKYHKESQASGPSLGREITVTYKITRLSRDLAEEEIRTYVAQAFEIWQTQAVNDYLILKECPVLNLKPSEDNKYDLAVMFDTELFKKYPKVADFDSVWHSRKKTIFVNDNKDLTSEIIVPSIAHEIGHYLGLRHEYGRLDLMNPYYKNLKLSQTDLRSLREALQCQKLIY